MVVPNYNHSPYLRQRIDSILNQTYQNFEIIILDDCSTDNSKEIIESFRNNAKMSHVIYSQKNSGSTFKQWEKGIELAKGKYIWIAESDDVASLNFLNLLVLELEKHDDVALIYSASTIKENDFVESELHDGNSVRHCGKSFIKNRMLFNPEIINSSAVLFNSSMIDELLLGEIIKYKLAGDWLFWNYLASKGDVIEVKDRLNFFRQHSANTSRKINSEYTFINEGFKVLLFTSKFLNIKPEFVHLKVWASIWAQFQLSKMQVFFVNFKTACSISLYLPFGFVFYYLKFKYLTKKNIKIAK